MEGGGGNRGLPPDPRVCGDVLCSEKINVPISTPESAITEPTQVSITYNVKCGAGTELINGICEVIPTSEPTQPEPQAEYIPEPTQESITDNVKCGAGTELINGICKVISTLEPETNDDLTKFYDWFDSIFG